MPYTFKSTWITEGADQEMVNFAEQEGKEMESKGVTSSQFRNIYGEIIRIKSIGYKEGKASFFLLQPKMAYAVARANGNARQGLQHLQRIIKEATPHISNDKQFVNFCNLIEAILAFHKQKTVENKQQKQYK